MLKLYRTESGAVVMDGIQAYSLGDDAPWDELLNRDDLLVYLQKQIEGRRGELPPQGLLAPIGSQEVWAAGVTYFRSRDARMEESQSAGGGSFYDRVYSAERPELFFKATPHRVVAPGGQVRIRRDSKWNVPEPELTLVIASSGKIIGYTIGNDMSSRDIEGENPLYLPQAKVYDGCCALGPGILVTDEPLPASTTIAIKILRENAEAFAGSTTLESLKRKPRELVDYLFRENSFPHGAFLMTGTGIIPPSEFTLQLGDRIEMTIDPIGTLVNTVA
ncbi:MAG TPA: fumarylacetoacetate hydrolase family protein [Tepidisphaeraceae bacterium]|nr:fumarylacetoacetate hydrolase family protein [Tepidisphaeraceae bacterium]